MLVYCGQMVGWIKMTLGTEVGVVPGNIVLVTDPAPPWKGAQQPPLFGPCLFWRNGRPSQQLLSAELLYFVDLGPLYGRRHRQTYKRGPCLIQMRN